jgi:polyhydroxybutyrate depolymerase
MDGSCHQGATCDAACITDADCQSLGRSHRCELGFCRSGNAICPLTTLPPGDQTREISVNGTSRKFTFHVPSSYSGAAPVPLVLDFHPMDLGATWEQANSGYRALSDTEGFVVAWPEGLQQTWDIGPCCTANPVDDAEFARAIVRQLSIEACVDVRRVYVVGFSMGGGMAYYLACKQAEVFAAIAPSSMDLPIASQLDCRPSRPVTVIAFRGSDDTIVPYAGGTTTPPGHSAMSMEVLGAVGTFTKWANIDGCTGSPSVADANGCSTYANCQDKTEVTLCTVAGGAQVIGDAAIAWQTLKRHSMP